MKIRTDFVTNSSSSSYITITFFMKDGTQIKCGSNMDDIGHGYDPDAIALMEDDDILRMLEPVSSGAGLLDALDDHFLGMFRSYPPTEEQLKGRMGDVFRELYEQDNQEAARAIEDLTAVKKIEIQDVWSGDYGKRKKKVVYDPNRKILVKGRKTKQ